MINAVVIVDDQVVIAGEVAFFGATVEVDVRLGLQRLGTALGMGGIDRDLRPRGSGAGTARNSCFLRP